MSNFKDIDFLRAVMLGKVDGHTLVHKFGKYDVVGTSPVPLAVGGVYQMPLANAMLEFVSDDAADGVGGSGAREIIVRGLYFLDGELVPQSEIVTTNGLTAVPLVNPFARVFRVKIASSGTYASAAALSSAGTLTLRGVGGGVLWAQVGLFGGAFSAGQSQISLYTTKSNSKAILYSPYFTIEASKDVSIFMLNREGADDVVVPYTGGRMVEEWLGLDGPGGIGALVPVSTFSGATDVGFMAEVAVGTAKVSAGFWLLEIDEGYW